MSTEPTFTALDAAARDEMLERLTGFTLTPRAVLDLEGGATAPYGTDAGRLRRRFPRARIIITRSEGAGVPAPRVAGPFAALRRLLPGAVPPIERLVATPDRLPLADGSIDLVLGHWLAPGTAALDAVLAELRRVLAPGGLFLWTTPGLGAAAEPIDMHDLGGALARAGFTEPVLDVDRHRATADGAVVEVIHAAAFAGGAQRGAGRPPDGETVVPLDRLGRRDRTAG